MRRLLVLVAFLARFAGQSYVWTARTHREPAPIERPLDASDATLSRWWMP